MTTADAIHELKVLPAVDPAEVDAALATLTELLDRVKDPDIYDIVEEACLEIAELLEESDDEELAQAA